MKKLLLSILTFAATAYMIIAVIYGGLVWLFGGPIPTAIGVGLQWPRIFWFK